MVKRTFNWFFLLVALWLTCCGLFSSIEPDANGFLRFGLPLTVYTDFKGLADEATAGSPYHFLNLVISLSALALLSWGMALLTTPKSRRSVHTQW
jgi:hypothetical protein